ncbi:uncharacterized protein [Centruroides vittatus]|uniref:uncharacterized protein n=1 Tax=Centruroides vittatus TaxID=120091 RepID=UPI00350F9208
MKSPRNFSRKKKEDACPDVTDEETKSDRATKTIETQTSAVKKRKLSIEMVNCNPPSKKQKLTRKNPCKVSNKKRNYKKKTTVAQKKRSSLKRTNRRNTMEVTVTCLSCF